MAAVVALGIGGAALLAPWAQLGQAGTLRPNAALELMDPAAGGRLLATLPLPDGAFTLVFTHSMYGGRVSERYRVDLTDRQPRLVRSIIRTDNGGAAEYYARYGNLRQDAVGWRLDGPELVLPSLRLRVDRVGEPRLEADGRTFVLLDLLPDGGTVLLQPAGPRATDPAGSAERGT